MNLTRRLVLSSIPTSALAAALVRTPTPLSRPARTGPDADGFLRAVRLGDAARVRRLLVADSSLARAVGPDGRSAIAIAAIEGHSAVAGALLATGLEPDLVESVLLQDWERVGSLAEARPGAVSELHPAVDGTALHAAALVGSIGSYRLRSLGCDPDAAPVGGSGFTPARTAVQARHVDWARIGMTELLSNGGDANVRQRHGDSILHGAVRRRSAELVRLAVRKGADVAAADDEGRTAAELADELGWADGVRLLEGDPAGLVRDNRRSRLARDASGGAIEVPDLSDVPQALQSEITGNSHVRHERVRARITADPRLVFARSTDDELPIEASAHIGNRDGIRMHLDHGAPLSLPTAVSLGDEKAIDAWLAEDPTLVHERGAHDFPVMWYAVLGGGGPAIAERLHGHGVDVDQESLGATALHWCARRGDRETARWLIEHEARVDPVGFNWSREGKTPLQVAMEEGNEGVAAVLRDAGG